MKIIRDTREQDPWKFEAYEEVKFCVDKLDYGDYTLVGHDQSGDDNSIIIERKKDCQELCGNLGTGWERLVEEAKGLSKYKYKQIVVCGPENFNYLIQKGFTKLNLNFIYSQIALLYIKYDISTVFFPNKEQAENYAYRLFRKVIQKTNGEN